MRSTDCCVISCDGSRPALRSNSRTSSACRWVSVLSNTCCRCVRMVVSEIANSSAIGTSPVPSSTRSATSASVLGQSDRGVVARPRSGTWLQLGIDDDDQGCRWRNTCRMHRRRGEQRVRHSRAVPRGGGSPHIRPREDPIVRRSMPDVPPGRAARRHAATVALQVSQNTRTSRRGSQRSSPAAELRWIRSAVSTDDGDSVGQWIKRGNEITVAPVELRQPRVQRDRVLKVRNKRLRRSATLLWGAEWFGPWRALQRTSTTCHGHPASGPCTHRRRIRRDSAQSLKNSLRVNRSRSTSCALGIDQTGRHMCQGGRGRVETAEILVV